MRKRKKTQNPEPKPEPRQREYRHKEAYMLMYYQCEACQQEEVIWNARDGVTPHGVACQACGGVMKHSDWARDVTEKRYVPEIGQRIFISMPYELAVVVARLRLKAFEGTEHAPPPPGPEREKLERSLAHKVYNDGDGPWLIRIE